MNAVQTTNPEVASTIDVGGIATNYHDVGEGDPVLLIHGSGPGVSAWANWRGVLPTLSQQHRVIAPDVLGFGYTERPEGVTYDMATWTQHLVGLLDALGLTDVRRTSYRRLSGGQQQRLALACAVVSRPELVFLDEPTAGLDAHARLVVWELIDRLRADGASVLLTTHLMDEAEELADHVAEVSHHLGLATQAVQLVSQQLSNGRVVFDDQDLWRLCEHGPRLGLIIRSFARVGARSLPSTSIRVACGRHCAFS